MKSTLTLFAIALAVCAQTATFDAASIKPNRSGGGGSSIRGSAGRLTMENVPLRKATLWAYGIPDDREYALIGPEWLANDRFDIQATVSSGGSQDDLRKKMQALLAERFKLQLHRETRQMPI